MFRKISAFFTWTPLVFMLVVMLLVVIVQPGSAHSAAHSAALPAAPPRLIGLDMGGAAFYTLDDDGSAVLTGRITPPPGFVLNWAQRQQTMALAPDGRSLALTMVRDSAGGLETGFFIYDIEGDTLRQVFVLNLECCVLHMNWSPASDAVLLEPVYVNGAAFRLPLPESYVYDLVADRWWALTNTPSRIDARFFWFPDGSKLFTPQQFGSLPGVRVVDRAGAHLDDLATPDARLHAPRCDIHWQPVQGRWYYETYCALHSGDFGEHYDRVLSMTAEGEIREELNPAALFIDLWGPDGRVERIDVRDLSETAGALLAGVQIGALRAGEPFTMWRVVRIDSYGSARTVFSYRPMTPHLIGMAAAPGGRLAALYGYDALVIGDLESGAPRLVQPLADEQWVCGLRWLDASRMVYNLCEGYAADSGTLWLLDADTGAVSAVRGTGDGPIWLLHDAASNRW